MHLVDVHVGVGAPGRSCSGSEWSGGGGGGGQGRFAASDGLRGARLRQSRRFPLTQRSHRRLQVRIRPPTVEQTHVLAKVSKILTRQMTMFKVAGSLGLQ